MTTSSLLTRTIKCLLAALLAHACMVRPFDEYGGLSNLSTSSGGQGSGSSWFGGSSIPTQSASSSGSWFSLPTSLPSMPSWLSGAGSSSSTQSSSSGQSSFSPSATQLAIGAAGAAAASLTTYYLYNLYKKYAAAQNSPTVTSSSTSRTAETQVVRPPATPVVAAQPQAPTKTEAWQLYNELLDEPPVLNKRTIPWSNYGQEVKGAIEHAQQYGSFDRLLNIINNHLDVVDKSHAAFALFIDNLKIDAITKSNPLIILVQTKPNILDEMPTELSQQLRKKLTDSGITIPPAPKQAAPTVENPGAQQEAHLDRTSQGA